MAERYGGVMIVIKIELWPFGDKSRKETIGEACIINTGFGTKNRGTYTYHIQWKRKTIVGIIYKFPRLSKTVWHLLGRILDKENIR